MIAAGSVARAVAVTVTLGVAAGVSPAPAHQGVRFWGAGSAAAVEAMSETGSTNNSLRGILLGVEGRMAVGPLALHVRYVEGDLEPTGDAGIGHRHVEGIALIGVTPLPGLELRGGPRLRALVGDPATQRWLVWQVGAQYESPVLAPWTRGVARAWVAVGGDVSMAGEFGSGRGGAAGILFRPANGAVEIRLDYSINTLRFRDGAGGETLEGVALTVGWGRR